MTEPIKFTQVRHRCPHCRRSWSAKRAAVEHITRCWLNPANRSCKTCDNYEPPNGGCCPGCDTDERCYAGVQFDVEPDEFGGRILLPLHCEKWERAAA